MNNGKRRRRRRKGKGQAAPIPKGGKVIRITHDQVEVPEWFDALDEDERAHADAFLAMSKASCVKQPGKLVARPGEVGMAKSALAFIEKLALLRQRIRLTFGDAETVDGVTEILAIMSDAGVDLAQAEVLLARTIFDVRLGAACKVLLEVSRFPEGEGEGEGDCCALLADYDEVSGEGHEEWREKVDRFVNPAKYSTEKYGGKAGHRAEESDDGERSE